MQTLLENMRSVVEELDCEIAGGPIFPRVTPQEIRSHLARYDFTQPVALDAICADVNRMLRTWHVQVTHPRYFGLFNPSVTFASVVADTLVAMYNPQLATWRTSPAANEIERHTLAWLASKFGFPENASASFTTGGAEANLTAVIVALTKAFPEYGEAGLRHLDGTPALYVTAEANHSFNKIVHMTGLGRRALRVVATDSNLRMDVADLARQVAADRKDGFAAFYGFRYRWDHRGRRHRSAAGSSALLGIGGPLVSCGRRLGRRRHPLAAPEGLSGGNRIRRFHHVRRTQMVLGADGSRNVFLPASGSRQRLVSRRDSLYAGGNEGVAARSSTPPQHNGPGGLSA